MKRFIVGLILSLSAAAAFAIPSPKQIEQALAARDYQSAQSMTQEVLREKPESAKAHLFNAYLLLKQGNKVAANEELNNVNRLDRNGNVKNSSLYGRTVAEMDTPTARVQPRQALVQRPVVQPASVQYAQPVAAPANDNRMGATLFIGGAIILVLGLCYFLFREPKKKVALQRTYDPSRRYEAPEQNHYMTPAIPEVPRRRVVYEEPTPVYRAPVPQAVAPSTVVVHHDSGMNSLVTGMMLNEAMHSHHGHDHHRDTYVERDAYVERAPQPTYESAAATSYESRASSFSSGSDDSWTSSSSSSSSSSDWGSSSDSSSSSDSGSWD